MKERDAEFRCHMVLVSTRATLKSSNTYHWNISENSITDHAVQADSGKKNYKIRSGVETLEYCLCGFGLSQIPEQEQRWVGGMSLLAHAFRLPSAFHLISLHCSQLRNCPRSCSAIKARRISLKIFEIMPFSVLE
jgi:hypothetical protein